MIIGIQQTARFSRHTVAKCYAALLLVALLAGTYYFRQPIFAGIHAVPSMDTWNLIKAILFRILGVGLLLGAVVSIELGQTVNWLTVIIWWWVDFKSVDWEEKPIRFVLGVAALSAMGLFATFVDVL